MNAYARRGDYPRAMFDETRTRSASAALVMLDLCAWVYAVSATLRALTG